MSYVNEELELDGLTVTETNKAIKKAEKTLIGKGCSKESIRFDVSMETIPYTDDSYAQVTLIGKRED